MILYNTLLKIGNRTIAVYCLQDAHSAIYNFFTQHIHHFHDLLETIMDDYEISSFFRICFIKTRPSLYATFSKNSYTHYIRRRVLKAIQPGAHKLPKVTNPHLIELNTQCYMHYPTTTNPNLKPLILFIMMSSFIHELIHNKISDEKETLKRERAYKKEITGIILKTCLTTDMNIVSVAHAIKTFCRNN